MEPALEPRDIIRKAAGVIKVYEPWIEAFEGLISRQTKQPLFREKGPNPTLRVVPYDWRKSAVEAAKRLADHVDAAAADHGAAAKLHIAAHSYGGLVARYYLQSGVFEDRPGFSKVASLLTFATPHQGSPIAVAGALGLKKVYFLTADQCKRLANDARYPALYELFPPQRIPVVWDRSGKGGLERLDLYDPKFGGTQGVNAQHAAAAQAFHAAIDGQMPPVRVFTFVGNRFKTLTHFTFGGAGLSPVETDDGGDGTVPLQGALLPGEQVQYTDKAHQEVLLGRAGLRALQEYFNADGLLAAAITGIELSARDQVVPHRGDVEVHLGFAMPVTTVEGRIFLERARPAEGDADLRFAGEERVQTINYKGSELTSISVGFQDMQGPGIFRAVFESGAGDGRALSSAFVVQRPT